LFCADFYSSVIQCFPAIVLVNHYICRL